MKLFIVDDSAIVCDRLSEHLHAIPNIEVIGSSGHVKDSITLIKKLKPDAVVLDIRLIDGNGIDVLYEIKHNMPEVKVLVFTNHPYPHYRERCTDEGADYFFNKSSEFEKLIETVKTISIN